MCSSDLIYRRAGRDEQRFQNLFEIVPQTYVVPLADFGTAGGFQPSRIRSIRIVFDRTPLGTVIMDDVGLNPGMNKNYLAARLNP